MKKGIIIAFFLLFFAELVNAFSIVVDISPGQINIDSDFKGQRVLVFGALIEKSDDVLVVFHGPEKTMNMSKKTKIMGVWTNGTKHRFKDIPQFYSVSYVKQKSQILNPIVKMGFDLFPSTESEFLKAFTRRSKSVNLYQENQNVEIIDNHLFRCALDLPSSITKGKYIVEIISFYKGKMIGLTSIPLFVNKVGIESWLFDMHFDNPIRYSFMAVFGALFVGWISSFLPKK